MTKLNPQYITDQSGKRISVVLPIKDYHAILEVLDEMDDVKLYDEAKESDTGERMLLSDYVKTRKSRNV